MVFFPECEWRWDSNVYPSTSLKHEGREVLFHPDYSCGTAAARGETILQNGGEHFWEVKMTSAVYGTDMVGFQTLDLFHVKGQDLTIRHCCLFVCCCFDRQKGT